MCKGSLNEVVSSFRIIMSFHMKFIIIDHDTYELVILGEEWIGWMKWMARSIMIFGGENENNGKSVQTYEIILS